MKKYLLTLIVLMGIGLTAGAQEVVQPRWDVNVSAGMIGTPTLVGAGEGLAKGIGEVFAVIFTFGLYKPQSEYERIDNNAIPAVAVQGGYQILPWLKLTLDGFYNYSSSDYYKLKADPTPEKTVRANRVALLPGVKFTFLNKGIFHMYGGVAAGGAVSFAMTTQDEQNGFSNVTPHFAWQLTTLGLALGNAFYGYTDFGFGSEFTGVRLGLGYKF